jgi:hypothetical protein
LRGGVFCGWLGGVFRSRPGTCVGRAGPGTLCGELAAICLKTEVIITLLGRFAFDTIDDKVHAWWATRRHGGVELKHPGQKRRGRRFQKSTVQRILLFTHMTPRKRERAPVHACAQSRADTSTRSYVRNVFSLDRAGVSWVVARVSSNGVRCKLYLYSSRISYNTL